jgi:hypothetical protein
MQAASVDLVDEYFRSFGNGPDNQVMIAHACALIIVTFGAKRWQPVSGERLAPHEGGDSN